MEKKDTRTAAALRAAVRTKSAQAANSSATTARVKSTKDLLEKMKLPELIEAANQGKRSFPGNITTYPPRAATHTPTATPTQTKTPTKPNPYLTASRSTLPVSPEVISFVYSLDGQAKGAKSPSDYDEQWKKCVFCSWHSGLPLYDNSFFEKEILEKEKSRFGGLVKTSLKTDIETPNIYLGKGRQAFLDKEALVKTRATLKDRLIKVKK